MATAGLTFDEVMAQSAQAKPQQGLVLDEAFDVIHQDDDKSEEEDFEDMGIRESVAGVIVIGLAVDYTIHLGHMYDHARFHAHLDTRDERTAYALRKMGRTVFAGAVTTAGAASLMFACQLTFFVQMACLIVFTIALSISLALGLYVPLSLIHI